MKTLLIDIETAPNKAYTWGLWNQNIGLPQIVKPGYTLCWSAKWLNEPDIMFSSLHETTELRMIKRVHKLIDEADAVVHYNGTKFDMPTLNNEFLKLKMNPPSPVMEIDLYRTVKRKFRLPSNKLDYVARHLGIKGKMSHKGMELWTGCMDGDHASWEHMKKYNIQDVILLEDVYYELLPWIPNHPNQALFDTGTVPVCPSCGGDELVRRGLAHTSTQSYQRFVCKPCGKWSRGRTSIITPEQRPNILVGLR
tara:strand:+ start:15857 stop:16612 length:756 start_codon:yes stop_codon:yes gene_type:complete